MSKSLIIIPTLNEKGNIETLVPQIFKLIPDLSVLVVDDSSSDGTGKRVLEFHRQFPNCSLLERSSNPGYGQSILDGFRWALNNSFDKIVTMDADFSHDFNEIPKMLNKLDFYEIVVGSRYVKGGNVKNWSFSRKLLSRFANAYVRTILGLPIHDSTSGFNAYRSSALTSFDFDKIHSEGYAFLVELKYRLLRKGLRFFEHPIIFYERREGSSKMSAGIIWESIWLPWRLLFVRK